MSAIKIKDGVFINLLEYNGNYRLEQGNEGADGKWWANRVIPLKWDKEQGKRVPAEKEGNMKIQLGDKASAAAVLKTLFLKLSE